MAIRHGSSDTTVNPANATEEMAGRSCFIGTESYAVGSNEDAGAYSSTVISSIPEPSPGYWIVVPHG